MIGNNPVNGWDEWGMRDLTGREQNIFNNLIATGKCPRCNPDVAMQRRIQNLANRYKEAITKLRDGESSPQIDITTEALELFTNPKDKYINTSDFLCSSFVRDVLRATGVDVKRNPNAAAFLKGNDRRFKKDYGFEAPQIQKESAKMGDVIAAGDAGLQQHAYSAHTGIYLGDALYISQSPSPRNDVISNSKPSTIKIRDVSDLKDREKITYRSMKNAK